MKLAHYIRWSLSFLKKKKHQLSGFNEIKVQVIVWAEHKNDQISKSFYTKALENHWWI